MHPKIKTPAKNPPKNIPAISPSVTVLSATVIEINNRIINNNFIFDAKKISYLNLN